MAASTSTIIGEPFQLYLGSTAAQKALNHQAISTTHNREFPGYATVTAQRDGIHVLDLQNFHAVASYSVENKTSFATPAVSLYLTEDGNTSVISYTTVQNAPTIPKAHRGRTIWVIRQNISVSRVASNEKNSVLFDVPPVQICATGRSTVPLLIVSQNGNLFLVDAQVNIKNQLDWPGEREHLETFVFPLKSCSFVQDVTNSCSSVAVTCCQTNMVLHVRLVLLGEEMVPIGTCEIPVASSASVIVVSGLTCSLSGVLSFIDSRGIWGTHQLMSLNSSSLVSTPISENLQLRFQRFTVFKSPKGPRDAISIVALGTSLVLLAALLEGAQDLSLQIWDLSYGILLAAQSMPVPSEIQFAHLSLTVADEEQVLLAVSPSTEHDKNVAPKRSSIYIVPVAARLKSSLATALGKWALTTEWLAPMPAYRENVGPRNVVSEIRTLLGNKDAQKAEQVFLKWVDSHSSKETALGHEFVKAIFKIILAPESRKYPYTPRITRCLLENAVVSTIMLDGHLISMLRQRGDWENLMFALTRVADISEDELMASAKFLIDRQHKNENAMNVDTSEGYVPPLWTYLSACVSYSFSVPQMRLAVRKHLPDARDLVVILEILENWIQGGTEHDIEVVFKSLATNAKALSSKADSPPYPKVIAFLQALLDASFVALLQYEPSHDVLHRILSYIEPEIMSIDCLEPLRGALEPFAKAQQLKETTVTSEESPMELKKRKKQLEEQASLSVGLYRLEELVI